VDNCEDGAVSRNLTPLREARIYRSCASDANNSGRLPTRPGNSASTAPGVSSTTSAQHPVSINGSRHCCTVPPVRRVQPAGTEWGVRRHSRWVQRAMRLSHARPDGPNTQSAHPSTTSRVESASRGIPAHTMGTPAPVADCGLTSPGRVRTLDQVPGDTQAAVCCLHRCSRWRCCQLPRCPCCRGAGSAGRAPHLSNTDLTWRYDREQAHLPAEQPPARQDAWLPAADAHSCRPRHPGGPPPQGPHRVVGLSRRVGELAPVLPAASKLRRSQDFAAVVRCGHRAGTRHLVVHLRVPPLPPIPTGSAARAGFVVSTKVGNSVVRHRVTRRLRPLVLDRLTDLPAGTDLVIRALPAAATASSTLLAADLDSGLRAAIRKSSRPSSSTGPSAAESRSR